LGGAPGEIRTHLEQSNRGQRCSQEAKRWSDPCWQEAAVGNDEKALGRKKEGGTETLKLTTARVARR
jgi:hypothetical protein